MKNKYTSLLFIMLFLLPIQNIAQNISVTSFKLLENDLTANTAGTMERDQNGEIAALIKVVTTEQGFVFDGGMVGVTKIKQGVGEVWVYVPHGIKKITIQHPLLGVLRDYYFPVPIDKAKAYEMVLATGKVETVVTHSINKQFVIFNVKPANAVVELNEEVLAVDGEGYAEKGLPFGTYNYRVSCANYYTEAGQVVVNVNGKAEVDVRLRPNFGWIKFDGASEYHGAHIYIDDERVGQLPYASKEIRSGIHRIKVVKSMYKTCEQQVTVADNETTNINVEMTPNFANVTLCTDTESEIWVDGKLKGKGEWTGPLEIGEYNIEVKRTSHRTQSKIVHITTLSERTIPLPSPTPIYGGVEITSTPSRATVYIDGVVMGETPLILSNVLIGTRELKLVKNGYVEQSRSVNVVENSNNQISFELAETPKEVMVNITSTPNRAAVLIDGKAIGLTPMSLPLKIGKYDFSASKKGYWPFNMYGKMIDLTSNNVHFNLKKIRKGKKVKPYNNRYYNGWSAYLEGNIESFYNSYGLGVIGGIYAGGCNAEFALQKNLYNDFIMRLGGGCTVGRNILITPQVGMHVFWGIPVYTSYSWESNETDYLSFSLSCRFQYCISKNIALSITPEYVFPASDTYGDYERIKGYHPCGLYLRIGLVFNWGSYCTDVSEYW